MQAAAPPPFETDLEIVDYDDDVDNQHVVQDVDHNSRNIQNQPPVETRRYPMRERRPPARLQDYIRS